MELVQAQSKPLGQHHVARAGHVQLDAVDTRQILNDHSDDDGLVYKLSPLSAGLGSLRFRSMEAAKDAANAVRNTVYTVAQKGDTKLFSGEDNSRQKAADKELEKTENVKTATGAPNVIDESDTQPMEKAKNLVDNLSKLGNTPLEV